MKRKFVIWVLFSLVALSLLSAKLRHSAEGQMPQDLVLKDIVAGPCYDFYPGPCSGAGRWLIQEGKFSIAGRAYFVATQVPFLFMGHPNAYKTMKWSRGTTHVLIGKNVLKEHIFDSDPEYPLTFKLVDGKGYVYLCGRGTVTTKDGKKYKLGNQDTVEMWLLMLKSDDPLKAEGAAQALGYLTKTEVDKKKVIPELIEASKSKEFRMYWNAIEALGRIGDKRALDVLSELSAKGGAKGKLADESIGFIKAK